MAVRHKRAYEPPARGDGRRILIDRLWPRGCRRNVLRIDAWRRPVTLVYAAWDKDWNNAIVVAEVLERLARSRRPRKGA